MITADKEELQSADKVIFPGVGEAETTMNHLKATGLDELIKLSLIHICQMEYPKFFINIESDWKSPFYLNNEVIKIVDIMELVCGIFYIKRCV